MMSLIYSGSTPKFLIKIKDEQGIILDPRSNANPLQISGVQVFIYNAITGVVFAKFYYGTAPNPTTGWTLMTVTTNMGTELAPDYRLKLFLSSAQTLAAEGNSNKIQINTSVVDADITGGTRVIIKTGNFSEIIKAKS